MQFVAYCCSIDLTMGPWSRLKHWPRFRRLLGYEETLWTRKVADEQVRVLVNQLTPSSLSALEISGRVWSSFGFASYRSVEYPAFDICESILPEQFDLIICEHIFEHLLAPFAAARNLHAMLKPNGHVLIVTPFIYKVHPNPHDCTRWTEEGLKCFLTNCGFASITSGSWGNRKCIQATLKKEYRLFNRHLHDLSNEPDYPMVVWALASK